MKLSIGNLSKQLSFAIMDNLSSSLDKIIEALPFGPLNDMQLAALEANKEMKDMLLLSDTGSGKTIGYLLPVLELLDPAKTVTQALIVVPSRELALQIETVFKSLSSGYKVTCCYGGHLRETEENNLHEAPALVIGTPGRLADHLRRNNIDPSGIETLVLDEFDKSIELGFEEEMSFIVGSLKSLKKRILISATEAAAIPDFVGITDPLRLNFLSGERIKGLTLQFILSEEKDKLETLFGLICLLGNRSTIVFCNHRESVERTSQWLKEKGIVNVFYHGAMEQPKRDEALCKFRNGTSNLLVTTDLASRGLDIPHLRYIIHYHLPVTEDIFLHRNGRTARMDASGTGILIIGPDESLPRYIDPLTEEIHLPEQAVLPEKPKWSTLFIAAGKKDKVNKVDVVGFLTQRGQLKKEDIGLIEVKDFISFVAVRKSKMSQTLQAIKGHKIKNRKVKIDIAK
jgi:superfamily II DNA/RNA helicase